MVGNNSKGFFGKVGSFFGKAGSFLYHSGAAFLYVLRLLPRVLLGAGFIGLIASFALLAFGVVTEVAATSCLAVLVGAGATFILKDPLLPSTEELQGEYEMVKFYVARHLYHAIGKTPSIEALKEVSKRESISYEELNILFYDIHEKYGFQDYRGYYVQQRNIFRKELIREGSHYGAKLSKSVIRDIKKNLGIVDKKELFVLKLSAISNTDESKSLRTLAAAQLVSDSTSDEINNFVEEVIKKGDNLAVRYYDENNIKYPDTEKTDEEKINIITNDTDINPWQQGVALASKKFLTSKLGFEVKETGREDEGYQGLYSDLSSFLSSAVAERVAKEEEIELPLA